MNEIHIYLKTGLILFTNITGREVRVYDDKPFISSWAHAYYVKTENNERN